MPIVKEQRKVHVDFSKMLKKRLESVYNQKFRSRVLLMVGDNPYIDIFVNDWKTEDMPNDLRLKVLHVVYPSEPDRDDVNVGNIRRGSIGISYRQWQKVLEDL